jgi:myo-inositol-1(or 4)-monophosphatase
MNLVALCADIVPAIDRIGHELWLKSGDATALQVNEKSWGDVATQMDCWAEMALKQILLRALPGSHFLGEETGGDLTDAPTWIVDPIDGTANFLRGYPQWSMSIGLAVGGQPVLGVVNDPNRREMFYACQGQGAWLRSPRGLQRLQCATLSEPLRATVSTVFPKPLSPLMQPYLAELEIMLRSVGQVRRSGSMALELAYLAAGRADAFWERGMQAWDAAAAMVLLEEAGAQMVAMDGLPVLRSQFLAAGSPLMLLELRRILAMASCRSGVDAQIKG